MNMVMGVVAINHDGAEHAAIATIGCGVRTAAYMTAATFYESVTIGTPPRRQLPHTVLVRTVQLTVAISLLSLCAIGRGESKKLARTIPCKTPEIAKSCYWTHGRLAVANGNPSYRLWKVGTRRLLGIYSGPAVYNGPLQSKYPLDNEGPELPPNVEAGLWRSVDSAWSNVIYADFEVCPLEKEQPEAMQAACIESAKNVVIRHDAPGNKKPLIPTSP